MVKLPGITLLLLGLMGAAVSAQATESLSYRIYYKGLLSAMSEVPIAEARLRTERAPGNLEISTLTLSSAAHDVVDALYPIRYRLRAVYDLADHRLVGMERVKRTRKFKHDLAWLDGATGRLHYLKADPAGPVVTLPDPVRPWVGQRAITGRAGKPVTVPLALLDRLTLLQDLRRDLPSVGQVRELAVTDGPKRYRYTARLDGTDILTMAGQHRPTWRLRVDGYEIQADGRASSEPDHPPIYVWISRDAQRLPLQFRIDHSVGDFTVAWVPGQLPVDVAMDVPPAANSWDDEG